MRSNYFFASVLSIGLLFSSCKKESTPTPTPAATVDANESKNNAISSGGWTVTSYTENGQERMQSALNSFTMTYKKEDKNNGNATWALIDVFGAAQNITGKYEIRNNGTEIDMAGDILGFTLSGNNLTIEGNYQGTAIKIVAKK